MTKNLGQKLADIVTGIEAQKPADDSEDRAVEREREHQRLIAMYLQLAMLTIEDKVEIAAKAGLRKLEIATDELEENSSLLLLMQSRSGDMKIDGRDIIVAELAKQGVKAKRSLKYLGSERDYNVNYECGYANRDRYAESITVEW